MFRIGGAEIRNVLLADLQTGRRVWIRDHDHSAPSFVILRIQCEILPQRNPRIIHLMQIAENRIKPVGDIGEDRSVLREGHEREIKDIVRAVGNKHIAFSDAVTVRDGVLQSDGIRIRVQA